MDIKNDLKYTEDFIKDYISLDECKSVHDGNYNCVECGNIETCDSIANDRCNSAFAESIDYDGCDSEEEFWEQLFG